MAAAISTDASIDRFEMRPIGAGTLDGPTFALLSAIDRPRLPARLRLRERLAARLAAALAGGGILCFPTTSAPAPPKGRLFGERREDSYMRPTLTLQTFATIGRLLRAGSGRPA